MSETIQIFEAAGKAAGVTGVSLGILLLIFRELIRKDIFPKFVDEYLSYKLLTKVIVSTWSIALIGILGWVYTEF